MAFPYRRILCPVDFDDNSMHALETAAGLARQNDGTVLVLHVVPMVASVGAQGYVDIYKAQEEASRDKLREIARKRLLGLKHELSTQVGDPAGTIISSIKSTAADLVVMATHGRRGLSRLFLGSVAGFVVREASCPVLTVRDMHVEKDQVGSWMTHNPLTAAPDEKLSAVYLKMLEGGFRCVPVVKEGVLAGIITDRDLRLHKEQLDRTEAANAMSENLITVAPSTSIREAARLLRERKVGALPVVEDGKLAGIITVTDVLEALTGEG